MIETDWFEDRGVDEPPRMAGLGWLVWFAAAVAMILIPLVYGEAS